MNDTRHKTLYLMRHGETSSNVDGRYQGSEEPLTERGQAQASALAHHLAKHHLRLPMSVLVSSTHVRALRTALPVRETLGITLIPSSLFIERKNPSAIRGKLSSEPEAYALWLEGRENFHDEAFTYADGETFGEMKARAILALDFILALPDKHVGLVTHGVFGTALAAVSQRGAHLTSHDLNAYQFRLSNTGLSILTHETHANFSDIVTGWVIQKWNDTSHLE